VTNSCYFYAQLMPICDILVPAKVDAFKFFRNKSNHSAHHLKSKSIYVSKNHHELRLTYTFHSNKKKTFK